MEKTVYAVIIKENGRPPAFYSDGQIRNIYEDELCALVGLKEHERNAGDAIFEVVKCHIVLDRPEEKPLPPLD